MSPVPRTGVVERHARAVKLRAGLRVTRLIATCCLPTRSCSQNLFKPVPVRTRQVALLKKAKLDDRLSEFFPPSQRNLDQLTAHFKVCAVPWRTCTLSLLPHSCCDFCGAVPRLPVLHACT